MRIRTKISFGYQIVLVLMIVLTLYLLYNVQSMLSLNRRLTEFNFAAKQNGRELAQTLQDLHSLDVKFFVTGEAALVREMQATRNDLRAPLSRLEETTTTETEKKHLVEFRELLGVYESGFSDPVYQADGLSREQLVEAENRMLASKESQVQRLSLLLSRMRDAADDNIEQQIAAATRQARLTLTVSLVVSLLALAAAAVFTSTITYRISKRLRRLQDGMKSISAGNLDASIQIRSGDELQDLAAGFNRMSERLKELDELKRDLVAHVSHELKSPIASIMESSNLMLEQLPGPINANQRKLLEITKEKSGRLLHMVNDILDLSRIDSGVMEYDLEPADLASLVQRDVEGIQPLAQERDIEIHSNVEASDMTVLVDKNRISQAFHNLLSNAIKFTPEGGKIEVSLRKVARLGDEIPERVAAAAETRSGAGVHFSVKDSGVGIDADELSRVFEKFYQARAGRRVSTKGTGLGLSITRSIVDAHRGAIWIDSEPGRGSVFHIALPAGAGEGKEVRTVSLR